MHEANSLKIPLKKVLDVGTGTARTLIELAKHSKFQECSLIGIDFYQDMVDIAEKLVAEYKLSKHITITHADVHQMPFNDDSIELIFGRSVIHHWNEPIQAYKEIYRILTPGDTCIIHEPSREPTKIALEKFNELRQQFGIKSMSLDEKYTAVEVSQQLIKAELEQYSGVQMGDGLAGLGFEERITKK